MAIEIEAVHVAAIVGTVTVGGVFAAIVAFAYKVSGTAEVLRRDFDEQKKTWGEDLKVIKNQVEVQGARLINTERDVDKVETSVHTVAEQVKAGFASVNTNVLAIKSEAAEMLANAGMIAKESKKYVDDEVHKCTDRGDKAFSDYSVKIESIQQQQARSAEAFVHLQRAIDRIESKLDRVTEGDIERPHAPRLVRKKRA